MSRAPAGRSRRMRNPRGSWALNGRIRSQRSFLGLQRRPSSLLMRDIHAGCLIILSGLGTIQEDPETVQHRVLTALPAKTHLRHGRAGSHPRCFLLQFTHADATCAFARLVDRGGRVLVPAPTEVGGR
jgi:hypothetical protein